MTNTVSGGTLNPTHSLCMTLKFLCIYFSVYQVIIISACKLSTNLYVLILTTTCASAYWGRAKNDPTCFCQNFVKSPQNLIIFGTQIAKTIKLCEAHSLSTSSTLPCKTQMLQIVTLHGDYQYQTVHLFIINSTEDAT